jgi:serine/threonine protein kinase
MSQYTFSELSEATDSFSELRIRGSGGFGKVFEAQLLDGRRVAVKRRDTDSMQGYTEFVTEIELCSHLSHPNVVSLLGYCDEGDEMILVYEYMGQGTLADHLYGSRSEPSLPWEQRLEILIGAGSGLQYLHSCTDRGIIHRDVKGPNILLGDDLVAKMADYGISKVGPDADRTHVTTNPGKGTTGYMDLEYVQSGHLSTKSDVYSFGVVCLEALCAGHATGEQYPWKEVGLATWAKQKLKEERNLRGIADKRIADTIVLDCLQQFTKTVMACLQKKRANRPSMEHVIARLESALELQRSGESSGPCSPPCPLSDEDSSDESSGDERRASRPGSLWRRA